MVHPELLEILVCPETKQQLELAEPATLDAVNALVSQGTLKTRGGDAVTVPLEAALVRQDRHVLYPIRDDLPIMLIDEAIEFDATTT